ncbi:MAG: inositol monophosphatase [Marinilabiliales bacterium]|nr:MAG: inositol monophosphatase [Marinilabiliales bacterium]
MDLQNVCEKVKKVAIETGNFIRNERRSFSADKIETKGIHNYVSYVDKQAESMLVGALAGIVPEAGFIAEEGTGQRNETGLNWIIDPLDGTTNFIHGLPPHSISIALSDNDRIVLGVIYEVNLEECFYSWEGAPAFLNGTEISVSETANVKDSLIATGFPYTAFDRMPSFLVSFEYFVKNSHGLRRLGSAAIDLAYVACGRFDAFYEFGLSPWDVAAGSFLVEQAGGRVSDFRGGGDYLFGRELVAANSKVFDEFGSAVGRFMN